MTITLHRYPAGDWVLRLRAGCGIAAGRWAGAIVVLGYALVDAAVDFGTDPLNQACRYRVVVRGAEVAACPDRCGDFLIPVRVHEPEDTCPGPSLQETSLDSLPLTGI